MPVPRKSLYATSMMKERTVSMVKTEGWADRIHLSGALPTAHWCSSSLSEGRTVMTSQRSCLPALFQWQVNFNTKFQGASKPQQGCRLWAQHSYAGLLQKTVKNTREVRLLLISISPHPVSEQIPDRCHGKNNLMQTPTVFIHWLGKKGSSWLRNKMP